MRLRPLDLNRVIRESRGILDRILGDDIEIRTELAPDLGIIQADNGQIHQVLMNIAANAREAMPSGGVLTIATRNLEGEPQILLEIRDTGHGMDERTRRHLFEPFFTTKKNSKNTGLGLAMVFGIVSHSGGNIDVQSQPGEGTAVRIRLPRIETTAEEEAPAPAEQLHHGSGAVLVVEDRHDVRSVTCDMLEDLGYRAMGAANGAEALLIAKEQKDPIPFLLTDVMMPGINGREVAEQLRRTNPRMKVIFMSGYSDRILNDAGKLQHPALYLQKPFTAAQLADVLRRADNAA